MEKDEFKRELDRYRNLRGDGKLLEAIEKDEDIVRDFLALGFEREDIRRFVPILSDYLDSKKACKNCQGLDKCQAPDYQMAATIKGDGTTLTLSLGYCEKRLKIEEVKSRFVVREFPEDWLSVMASRQKRMLEAYKYLRGFLETGSDSGCGYLIGEPGVGKSFILAQFLKTQVAAKGTDVAFIDCSRHFEELKDLCISKRQEFQRRLDLLMDVDVLALDNFGAEFKSPYVRDQIVVPLLSARFKNRKTTYFTSIYDVAEIKKMYGSLQGGALPMKSVLQRLDTIVPYVVTSGFKI